MSPTPADFAELDASGRSAGPGRRFGLALAAARDAVARGLLRAGLTPNAVSWAGLGFAVMAAAALVVGASGDSPLAPRAGHGSRALGLGWPLIAGLALVLSGFLDVVDGRMARLSDRLSLSGGILDSAIDRLADLAVYVAIAMHFAALGRLTPVLLAQLALAWGFLIAYLRARAEAIVPHAAVGFWQRSERCFAMGFAIGLGHVETGLLVVGTLPVLTVLRRWRQVMAVAEGRREPEPPARIRPFAIWRHPRGSLGYDAIAIAVLAFIALAPVAWPWLESGDALRNALVRLVGAAGG